MTKTETVVYFGIAFNKKEVVEKMVSWLPNMEVQKSFHTTYCFKPSYELEKQAAEYFGRKTTVKVVGAGYYKKEGGKIANVGLMIDKGSLPFARLYKNPATPHLTMWISREKDGSGKPLGKAVETKFCQFERIEPFELDVVFGWFDQRNDFHTHTN